jgi:hydrogenase expression/formation protein HypE
MRKASDHAGVTSKTGDTKVVDRGKGDGMFINTAGIGMIEHELTIAPRSIQPGDAVIINGDLARHGMAIMAVREGLEFESEIQSDTAALADLVLTLLAEGIEIHCLRDLTRGGLGSALNEIAMAASREIAIEEAAIPVRDDVAAACEILGIDPLYVANEGRMVAFIAAKDQDRALTLIKNHPLGQGASLIGHVIEQQTPLVTIKTRIGVSRILDMLSGEQLPRIC